MLRECIHCDVKFNPNSPQKQRAGGRINECPDCSSETTVKYLGLMAGDGKQAGVTVLKFNSESDRARYADFWRNNSGMHKSRSCQLGSHLSTDPGIQFGVVLAPGATNHKGRM